MEYDQTYWAPVKRRGPLPTYYYHAHFIEMLDFVEQHYAHVLLEDHVRLIREFRALSPDAQCLYVRLVNRKGRVFATGKLRYPELADIPALVSELKDSAWVSSPRVEHFADLLGFLTRNEIHELLAKSLTGISRSLRKCELVSLARAHCEPETFLSGMNTGRILVQQRVDDVRYILFLYFGKVQDGLSQFTMRDLGLVNTQEFRETYEPRFQERKEALEHFYFAVRLHRLGRAGELAPFVRELAFWPDPEFAGSAAVRDKLAYRLGRKLEQNDLPEPALTVYRKGESTRCSEKVVRLLLAGGQRTAAEAYLERCLENPRSDEEWLVARDIFDRKFGKKKTSALTDLLRASATIDLDESQKGAPERAAADYFSATGIEAHRTENALWRTLFGLLFWDELFSADDAALHSPFEFLPTTLTDRTFIEKHHDAIEKKLVLLGNAAAIKRKLLQTSTAHYGTPNGVFRWRRSIIDSVFALVDSQQGDASGRIIRRLCEDYKGARYGYPDLMLIDEQGIRFVEIKSEGDQLRRNQLLRIEQLRAAGFRADVVRVRWGLDPGQVYVVVDVETTGGRGENHRVTEIGAVKVRNGEIVGTFQTLLNPQRSIPPGITRLTGISPAMVAEAPCFIDIADEFETFLEDAIFVAHNVEFDYGFISREFQRIGRSFRHPKLCTCTSMRKLFPGRKSYSLAELARAYDIPLQHHHRAMCDAEAATQLLLIINEERRRRLGE